MPVVSANGIDIYYERAGTGPRLLFFNGSGSTLATSGALIELLHPAVRCRSPTTSAAWAARRSRPGPYSMADYAADAAALLDAVGWDRCRVVGISFGGMVAQELAVTWPERVERLALACTSPGGEGGASYPLHELAAPGGGAGRERPRLLDTRFTRRVARRLTTTIAALAEMMAGAKRPARSRTMQNAASRSSSTPAGGTTLRIGWRTITCPTLVACGRYDGIAPAPNAEAIAARVPDAELRMYEGGHAFFAQDPAALPDITGFLGAASSP